jgi:hypothetical protein
MLATEVSIVPPSRLLNLLQQGTLYTYGMYVYVYMYIYMSDVLTHSHHPSLTQNTHLHTALKYQQLQGLLPKDRRYDLFKGGARSRSKDEAEKRTVMYIYYVCVCMFLIRIV